MPPEHQVGSSNLSGRTSPIPFAFWHFCPPKTSLTGLYWLPEGPAMKSLSGTKQYFAACSLSLLLASLAYAKDTPTVMVWPDTGTPVVQFTFGKLRTLESVERQQAYTIDTQVQNVWTKRIAEARFSLYLFDKKNVRIGEGLIAISDVAAGQTVKFETNIMASGQVVSMKIAPQSVPEELQALMPTRTISLTVNSVPQGARFTVDGRDGGTTPKAIKVGVGTHLLEFDKEGFNRGKYPFSIGPDDVSGGSVSYELGTSAHDTIEMRDGSVLSGDLLSISATEVVVKIAGAAQTLDRNQIKRITLVQRESENQ